MSDSVRTVRYKVTQRRARTLTASAVPGNGKFCVHGAALTRDLETIAEQDPRWTQNAKTPGFEVNKKTGEYYISYVFDGYLYHKPLPRSMYPVICASIDLFDITGLAGTTARDTKRASTALRKLRALTGYETVVLDPSTDTQIAESGLSTKQWRERNKIKSGGRERAAAAASKAGVPTPATVAKIKGAPMPNFTPPTTATKASAMPKPPPGKTSAAARQSRAGVRARRQRLTELRDKL